MNYWVWLVGLLVALVIEIVLICNREVARKVPTNYILLFLFTVCEAWVIASIAAYYSPEDVYEALLITAAVVILLTVFALLTKKDYTVKRGVIFVVAIGLLIAGIMALFFRNTFWDFVIYALIVILVGIYLVIDTQMLAGGGQYKLSLDDYIVAAMIIYIDIVTIFIYILAILGSRR
mmetsp:Transcript_15618/g.11362  ORF Transcript_15618/g.11362 Transcript_15618/m.11362 type:complete len:177 (-) Transcript_15618:38-568(-)